MAYNVGRALTASVDPLGNRTSYAYDVIGRQAAMTNPLGMITSVYDNASRLIVASIPGNRTSVGYDAASRRVSTTNPLGFVNSTCTTTRGG